MKIIVWGLLAVILAGEIVLRFVVGLGDPPIAKLDPAIEYILVPNAEYQRWNNDIKINNVGLRGPDVLPKDKDAEMRVLLIGDSVIYGTHKIDQTETIGTHLRAEMIDINSACLPNVISVAVSSWGPFNQRAYLSRYGTFDADTALIVLSAHDLYDVPTPNSQYLPYRLVGSWTAIGDAATAYLERRRPTDKPLNIDLRQNLSVGALREMIDNLVTANIQTTLVYHPTVSEHSTGSRRESTEFAKIANDMAVPFIDLNNRVDAENAYLDHIHPNGLGAKRIAEALARAIDC